MIYVFKGDDREKISKEILRILGPEYEVFEGENLDVQALINVFRGASLFATERKILIKDLTPPPRKTGEDDIRIDFYAEMLGLADTKHTVVIWESYTTTRKSYKDFIKLPQVIEKKYSKTKSFDSRKVFDVFDMAYRDGGLAVKMLNEIKTENDPYMFFGLMASQALKKYDLRAGVKEKRVLSELSKLDMQMKSTTIDPWTLISSFLLQVSSL